AIVDAEALTRLQDWRTALHRGERTLGEFCEREELRLAVNRLVYLSHWLTPLGRAKRFDTRFFVAEVPAGQTPLHDGAEMVGHRHACYDIQPGVAVRLSPRLIRVTANNGSVMTGPGTNTYLVGGGGRNEWAAIDPGPLDPRHVDAILAAAPGPIRWIFATHT